jgi:hypothetical protein
MARKIREFPIGAKRFESKNAVNPEIPKSQNPSTVVHKWGNALLGRGSLLGYPLPEKHVTILVRLRRP